MKLGGILQRRLLSPALSSTPSGGEGARRGLDWKPAFGKQPFGRKSIVRIDLWFDGVSPCQYRDDRADRAWNPHLSSPHSPTRNRTMGETRHSSARQISSVGQAPQGLIGFNSHHRQP